MSTRVTRRLRHSPGGILLDCPDCGAMLRGVRNVRVCYAHDVPRWFTNDGQPAGEPALTLFDPTRIPGDADTLYLSARNRSEEMAAIDAEDLARDYSGIGQ